MQQVAAAAFDREEMLDRLGGDNELLTEVVGVFLAECPRMMQAVRSAVDRADPTAVRRAAHAIRGALLNISAGPAAAEATQLESLGTEGRLGETTGVLERLEVQIERLARALVAKRVA